MVPCNGKKADQYIQQPLGQTGLDSLTITPNQYMGSSVLEKHQLTKRDEGMRIGGEKIVTGRPEDIGDEMVAGYHRLSLHFLVLLILLFSLRRFINY